MQLRKKRAGHVRRSLATLSASLLAAGVAGANDRAMAQDAGGATATTSQVDAAILVYREENGRVLAIEPSLNATLTDRAGGSLTFGLVSDSLTGASPNGAAPSNTTQTFITPVKTKGSSVTVTSASGGSVVIQLPGQQGLAREYTASPGELPVDKGFHDQREAGNIGWSQPLAGLSRVGAGFGYSTERDYQSISGNASVAQDFNTKNTTVSLAVNYEADTIFPYGGVPTPFTGMSSDLKGPDTSKKQMDFVLGLTQLVNRYWLVQLNYSYGLSDGYQNDPYRIISQVDPITGEPNGYTNALYESRPDSRRRQSIYLDNKVDIGPNVADLSFRYYTDDWGINSTSAELSDRLALVRGLYIEPDVRWYQQTAADFFHYYLVLGQPLPRYASSDTRLGKFSALTYGLKLGFSVTKTSEIYVRGQFYSQSGDGHPADAIGQLKQQDLFGGVNAISLMTGYSWYFNRL